MSKWIFWAAAAALLFSTSGAFAAQPPAAGTSGIVMTGYLDVQHQWNRGNIQLDGQTPMAGIPSGFVVHQGAMVLNHEFGSTEMTIDIPFRSNFTTGTQSNDLELATKEAQAFVKHQYDNGVFWQLGQFDSSFGLEPNDTTEILFARHGIMTDFVPNTHTGFLVGYTFIPFFIQALVANPNATSRQPANQSAEFAVRMGWSQEPMQVSVGASYVNTDGTYLLNNGTTPDYEPRLLFDLLAQARMKKLELGGQLDVAQSRLGKANTVQGPKDHELVIGYLVQAIYNVSDKLGVGVRYEYLRNDETNEFVQAAQVPRNGITTRTGQGGYLSKMSLGVRQILNEELMAKVSVDLVNLNIGQDSPQDGKTESWVEAAVGVIYDF